MRRKGFFWNKKRKKLKIKARKKKLFFRKLDGILTIRKNKNNLFITLAAIDGKVVLAISSGNVKAKGRDKRSLETTKKIANLIKNKIGASKTRYKYLYLRLHGRAKTMYVKTIVYPLVFSGVRFLYVHAYKQVAHNGVRCKKIRRK